nr:formylglycine-generating enzyme family protein [Brevibacterium ravenspurgense]
MAVPGGSFLMGDPFDEGYPSDGEQPQHHVSLDSFSISPRAATNKDFFEFVVEIGYVTDAESFGSSVVFHLLVRVKSNEIVGPVGGAQWWTNVLGANWSRPLGSRPSWKDYSDHPVVHVSWNDAKAYCDWTETRLPTEAEWEFAARGGLQEKRYPWADELVPEGEHRCNVWQGAFPISNSMEDGYPGTSPADEFAPNGYGLHQMVGSTREWCSVFFASDYYLRSPMKNPIGPASRNMRVMRGGSYLCHDSYCNRYRVATWTENAPGSSSGNCGFRVANKE